MTTPAAITAVKPKTSDTDTPPIKHLFHKCDRDQKTRQTHCGLKFPNVGMKPFEGRLTPEFCVVCADLSGRECPRCGD